MAQSRNVDIPQFASDYDDNESMSHHTVTGVGPPRRKKRAYNYKYCDLHGRIKENAETLHHVLQGYSRERAITDSYCTLPLAACNMNQLLHASER